MTAKFLRDIQTDRPNATREKIVSNEDEDLERIIDQYNESLKNIKFKFNLIDELDSGKYKEQIDYILRAQIAFVFSSLDYYIHEITKYALLKMFKGELTKTKSYSNFVVSINAVEKAVSDLDSVEWLSEEIKHRNSHNSFLSIDNIQKQLSLISDKKIYAETLKDIGEEPGEFKEKMNEYYSRRNSIVHQGDYCLSRYEKVDIDLGYVKNIIDCIDNFVQKLHEKLPR